MSIDTSSELRLERQGAGLAAKLNWLRAGVLGANDGIVSVAAVVVGVAGVTTENGPILAAGMAAVVGGAVSMALGEYVSVSSQSDSQKEFIERETRKLRDEPEREFSELVRLYQAKGLSEQTASTVATELTATDALRAHLDMKLGIEPDDVVSPWHAAFASAISFLIGSILPMLSILLLPEAIRVPFTFASVLFALALTGWVGAWIGGGSKTMASTRVVLGGAVALAATFAIGSLLGARV